VEKSPDEINAMLKKFINPNGLMSAWNDPRIFSGNIKPMEFFCRKRYKPGTMGIDPLICGRFEPIQNGTKICISIGRSWIFDLAFFVLGIIFASFFTYVIGQATGFPVAKYSVHIALAYAVILICIVLIDFHLLLPDYANQFESELSFRLNNHA
jgi:hypothetical protein